MKYCLAVLAGNGVACCAGDGQERVLQFIAGSDLGFHVEVSGWVLVFVGFLFLFSEGCFSWVVMPVLFKKCIPCV